MTQHTKRLFPTFDHVWVFMAIVLFALRPLLTPIPPHDFWWHMATGRTIVTNGSIPVVDSFSYTQAGEPFYNQGWLAQVLLYGLYVLGNIELIVLFQSIVIALTYGLLLALCIERTQAVRVSVSVLLLIIMPMSFDNWNVRPQSYALPLFVGFLFVLHRWHSGKPAHLWVLPLLMLLWVNIHGSFVLGCILIVIVFASEWARQMVLPRMAHVLKKDAFLATPATTPMPSLRQLFVWGGITAATMFINPRGWYVLAYVFHLLSTSAVTQLVTEWAPPTIRSVNGAIFFVGLIGCGLVLTYARLRPHLLDMLLVLPFLWLALGAARNVVWFGIVVAPLLTTQLATFLPLPGSTQTRYRGVPMLNMAMMALIGLLLIVASPWVKPSLGLPPTVGALLAPNTPIRAVESLHDMPHPPKRLFHAMSYGSYLIWALPKQPVFTDPRIELYPYQQWQDYIRLNNASHVEQLFQQYAIDGLLLDNEEQTHLLAYVRQPMQKTRWRVVYEDDTATLLVR